MALFLFLNYWRSEKSLFEQTSHPKVQQQTGNAKFFNISRIFKNWVKSEHSDLLNKYSNKLVAQGLFNENGIQSTANSLENEKEPDHFALKILTKGFVMEMRNRNIFYLKKGFKVELHQMTEISGLRQEKALKWNYIKWLRSVDSARKRL